MNPQEKMVPSERIVRPTGTEDEIERRKLTNGQSTCVGLRRSFKSSQKSSPVRGRFGSLPTRDGGVFLFKPRSPATWEAGGRIGRYGRREISITTPLTAGFYYTGVSIYLIYAQGTEKKIRYHRMYNLVWRRCC